jgi:hypothetical protein
MDRTDEMMRKLVVFSIFTVFAICWIVSGTAAGSRKSSRLQTKFDLEKWDNEGGNVPP